MRPGVERAAEGARASGTPFISFFTPTEMLELARNAGFKEVQHVSADQLARNGKKTEIRVSFWHITDYQIRPDCLAKTHTSHNPNKPV